MMLVMDDTRLGSLEQSLPWRFWFTSKCSRGNVSEGSGGDSGRKLSKDVGVLSPRDCPQPGSAGSLGPQN